MYPMSIHLYLRHWAAGIALVVGAGTGSGGGGVACGLGADNACGAPWAGPLELGRSVGGFLVDDQHAAEDEAESVGDDGGAAGGDAALGDEDDEMGESRVDFLGGLEGGGDFAEEIGGEIGTIGGGIRSASFRGSMLEAKAGGRILNREAAASVGTSAAAATGGTARSGYRLGSCGSCVV